MSETAKMPRALTATEPARLDLSRPGTPASAVFDDIYFSVEGGLAESEAVFLGGCGLPEGWMGREHFTICETGFGTGLNFLVTWRAWLESGCEGHLHFLSIERYPLDTEQLREALSHFPEIGALAESLILSWPGRVKGTHRLTFENVTLDLWHMDVSEALSEMDASIHAWFLDGFAPAKNPDMWSDELFAAIRRLSAPGARLATFTVAGHVRRGLEAIGFSVDKVPGFGRKRHRLEARLAGTNADTTKPSVIIIGAGIAGASVARACLRQGITPVVIRGSDHVRTAASANPRALVKPRLDRQDRPESRFFLQAWLFARSLYEPVQTGIVHYATSEAEEDRFWDLDEQAPLPRDHIYAADAALYFPTAPVIDPVHNSAAFCEGAELIEADVTHWMRDGDDWVVSGEGGEIARASHLVLASGLHVKTALPALNLRASRGQLSRGRADLAKPVTYGGYAVPFGDDLLLGATHDRLDDGDVYALRAADDARNAESFRTHVGLPLGQVSGVRASVRVNSADTLPIVDELEDGLFVLTALGSRGFSHAPLLGEALMARILRRPSPLAASQVRRLSIGRGRD